MRILRETLSKSLVAVSLFMSQASGRSGGAGRHSREKSAEVPSKASRELFLGQALPFSVEPYTSFRAGQAATVPKSDGEP